MQPLQPALATPPTSPMAVASLVLGLLGWTALPVVGSLGAIVCGHLARGEIRRDGGRVGGDGLAVSGLVLGYAHLALVIAGLMFALLFFGGLAALLAAIGMHSVVTG
ncbi:MAG: DUF4190 domain-containing protein [Lysobacter sp.]|nr:MAG: DUF4190 domain-containing protein [Lysobacter sp.]